MGPVEPARRAEGQSCPVGSKPGTARPGAPPPHPLQSGTLHCAMPPWGWDGASPPGPDHGSRQKASVSTWPAPSAQSSRLCTWAEGQPGRAQVVTPHRGAGGLQDGVEPDPPPHPVQTGRLGRGQQLVQTCPARSPSSRPLVWGEPGSQATERTCCATTPPPGPRPARVLRCLAGAVGLWVREAAARLGPVWAASGQARAARHWMSTPPRDLKP